MNSIVRNEAISSPAMAEPPPIMLILPFLRTVLSWSSSALRFGLRFLLTLLAPLYLFWPVAYGILSPIIFMIDAAVNIILLIPLSLMYRVVVALYPFYVFCAVACLTGAAVGVLGRYLVGFILDFLAHTEYFSRPTKALPAAPPSTQQPGLRKRKRKSVRIQ